MIDDLTLITHDFPDTIKVIPVGDVHLGAIEHDAKAWESFLQSVLAEPNTYIFLLGDLIQNNVKSSVGNPLDAGFPPRPREQKAMMTEYLKPLADAQRILAAVSGNHEARTSRESDADLTYDIMCKLGVEHLYREYAAFVKISLGRRGTGKAEQPNVSYVFTITHGTGGGVLSGSTINRNERSAQIVEGCDCFIAAHTHKGMLSRPNRLVIDPRNKCVTLRSCLVLSAVSWMTYGGYALQKMLLPHEHGKPQVLTLPNDKDKKRIEVTW